MDNPYSSPVEASSQAEQIAPTIPVRRVWLYLAYGLLVAPIPAGLGFRFWALNYAPGWFVTFGIEPERRVSLVHFLTAIHIASLSVLLLLPAFLIFAWQGKYRWLTGAVAAILGLPSFPAFLVFWLFFSSWLNLS